MAIVAPSVLSANFADLRADMEEFNRSKAEWLHFDVMDGHFVPNLSFGTDILKQVGKLTDKYLDVHIMVSNPLNVIEYFKDCRIDNLTFHYEACQDENQIKEVIESIRAKGWQVGISVKPKTDVRLLEPYLDMVDLVLVMSVEPGFGGQSFMEDMMEKGDYLYEYKQQHGLNYHIEIDGGIKDHTGKIAAAHHFEVLVAGSYCFKHPEGFQAAVDSLVEL